MLANRGWLAWIVLAVIFWIIGVVVGAVPAVPAVVGTVCYLLGGLFFVIGIILLLVWLLGGRDRVGGRGPLV